MLLDPADPAPTRQHQPSHSLAWLGCYPPGVADFFSTIFVGLVVRSIYALSGTGLVLTYRISGVFNFAQGAIGMFFAYVYFQLNQGGEMNLVFGRYTQTWMLREV